MAVRQCRLLLANPRTARLRKKKDAILAQYLQGRWKCEFENEADLAFERPPSTLKPLQQNTFVRFLMKRFGGEEAITPQSIQQAAQATKLGNRATKDPAHPSPMDQVFDDLSRRRRDCDAVTWRVQALHHVLLRLNYRWAAVRAGRQLLQKGQALKLEEFLPRHATSVAEVARAVQQEAATVASQPALKRVGRLAQRLQRISGRLSRGVDVTAVLAMNADGRLKWLTEEEKALQQCRHDLAGGLGQLKRHRSALLSQVHMLRTLIAEKKEENEEWIQAVRKASNYDYDFDVEDLLELLHDRTVMTPEMWYEFEQRLHREVQPLLDRLDPLHFGLNPEDHVALDRLAPWETREYWDMVTAQWMANQPSLLQADEMYALHAQEPLAWPYERLAATYGCSVDAVKEAMLLGAARGTRRDGRPFNIEEARKRLFLKERDTLLVNLSTNPLKSLPDAQTAYKHSDSRLYPSFFDDSTLLEEVVRAQQAQEPTLAELQTQVEMGVEPVDSDLAFKVKQRRLLPESTSPEDTQLQRDGQDYFVAGERVKPPLTVSIRDFVCETKAQKRQRYTYAREMGIPRHKVKDPVRKWHLVRHRDGTLRAGTLEELEYLTRQPEVTPPIVKFAQETEVKQLLERQSALDVPFEPKVKGKLNRLRRRMREKVEAELLGSFRAQAAARTQLRLSKHQRR
eukprot:EG_transcript_5451